MSIANSISLIAIFKPLLSILPQEFMNLAAALEVLLPDASALLQAIRQHWTIENSFHWVLDVTFGEDRSRIRTGNAPQNISILRHLALNIIKRDTSKGGIKQKRYRAAMDNTFLLNLLTPV